MTNAPDLLVRSSLAVDFSGKPGVLRGLNLEIRTGEIVGLVGESGGGKSTFSLALLGLLDPRTTTIRGSLSFRHHNLLTLPDREFRRLRGRSISLVPQSPVGSLSPRLTVGGHLREAWLIHEPARDSEWRQHALAALQSAQLPVESAFLDMLPGSLSVGMAQRLLIAMAILHRPALLIADEPTSALDLIHQTAVLELFRTLRDTFGMAVLLITHDLYAAAICDSVAVLHEGVIVEQASPAQLFTTPAHPYTRALASARN
jgi:ABC-type dipeptide/oligopeptide/nickel transport system ATPase component